MSILIRNAILENGYDEYIADMYIENGKIIKIGKNLKDEADTIIDGTNKYLLPGGIDVHTHLDLDLVQFRAVDDFYTGTVAAAFGGTTTIVDHIAFGPDGCSLQWMIDNYHGLAKGKAVIDYSFHGVIRDVNDESIEEIGKLFDQGIVSLKIYTTYGGMLQDDEILRVLKRARETGTVVCVHCENHGAIEELRREFIAENKVEPKYHALSRPNPTEAEAIARLIYLSEIAGYPKLYIVHTSTKEGLDEIKKARARGVKNLYCETYTQYLTLTDDRYEDNIEGLKYIMAPPLRKQEDVEALWDGVISGDVDVIATDHCPFFFERDKLSSGGDFSKTPGGAPGIEERMELVLSEGEKRNIPIRTLIEKLVINPARIFGLYPRKGTIDIGADADIVLYDKTTYKITQSNRHSIVDYTGYEGFTSNYKVDTVIANGEVIVEKGKDLTKKGAGRFIPRSFK